MTSDFTAIAAQLPDAARALFAEALAIHAQLPADYPSSEALPASAVFEQAMAAIGLAAFVPYENECGAVMGFVDRPVLAADALTGAQRAVIEALIDRSELFNGTFPVPCTAWSRKQWLGLVPAGPLWRADAGGEPRYHVLRRLLATGDEAMDAYVAELPPSERAALLVELDFAMGDLWWSVDGAIQQVVGELDDTLGAWAQEAAERILVGDVRGETCSVDFNRSLLVYAALVKAGVPITPRYEALLRYTFQPPKAAHFATWVAAIPEGRREAAVLHAVSELLFMHDRVLAAARCLARWPWPSLAIFAETNIAECRKPKDVKQAIKDASEAHPELKKALAAWRKTRPKPLKLKVKSVQTLAELLPLSALQSAQLEAAAVAYNGVSATAAQIVAGESEADEPIDPNSVEYLRIEGAKGAPAFDVWRLMSDSGTVFRGESCESVAGIVQFDLDCADKPLAAALSLALRGAD